MVIWMIKQKAYIVGSSMDMLMIDVTGINQEGDAMFILGKSNSFFNCRKLNTIPMKFY
jgi:alanine racemase